MLETNVNGLIRMTRLCLPHIRDGGHIVNIGSIAGRQAYENARRLRRPRSSPCAASPTRCARTCSAGRSASRRSTRASSRSNFSRVRFRGDEEKASAVYANVEPLTPDDVAECVLFAVTRPPHVNVDELVVKALAQSSARPDPPRRLAVALTILEGSTFCICDERGDIGGETQRPLRRRHALPLAAPR